MSEEKQQPKKELERLKAKISNRDKAINYWQVAFLVLLGLVVGSFLFFGSRMFQKRDADYLENIPEIARQGEPVLTITSKKQQVNQFIDFFLEDFQKGSDVKYSFYLENEALLNGEFSVLGMPVQFYLYFDPYVMENGNIQLKAKSLSIGTLGLPINEIMKYIERSFKLPEWVIVDPDKQVMLLRLDQYRLKNGMYIKAEKINLVDDDIRFNLYLPEETSDKKTSSSESEGTDSQTTTSTREEN